MGNTIGNGHVLIDRDGHRADLYLNRPDKRNAMNREVLADLTEGFRIVDEDPDVRAVAFLGKGPVFCAGMDLNMMYESPQEEHEEIGKELRRLLDTIGDTNTPVVAGIKRAAVAGAFELTLPTDLRILGEEAKYGVIEVELGVFPSGGTTQRLPRLVGLAKAKEMVLTAEYIDPEEADRINLVTDVVPDEEVDDRARELADEITTKAPLGIRRAMEAFTHTFDVSLSDGLDVEGYLAHELYDTEDRKEGFKARLEGREPDFKGR